MTVALSQEAKPVRARGGLALMITLMLVAAATMVSPLTSAQAAYAPYLLNHYMNPGEQDGGPTFPSIGSSAAYGFFWVATAAHTPGGWSLYGSYVTGYGGACHSYAAGNPLGGMAQNAELYAVQPMNGWVDTTASC